jgi:hypothetical protein
VEQLLRIQLGIVVAAKLPAAGKFVAETTADDRPVASQVLNSTLPVPPL